MSARMGVLALFATVGVWTSQTALGRSGDTFNLPHAVHPKTASLSDYIEDPVPAGLANATRKLVEDQQRCGGDATVCLNLVTDDGASLAFGTEIDGLDKVNDDNLNLAFNGLTGSSWHANIPFKVVTEIKLGNVFCAGVTSRLGESNTLIVFDTGSGIYAHEFGHQCAIDEAGSTECADLVMRPEEYIGAHDALRASDAFTIDGRDAPQRTAGTTDCPAIGKAAFGDISAVSVPGGVEISFSTLWQVHTSSFDVQRVDPATGATLYTLGPVPGTPGVHRIDYAIEDPSGIEGAAYLIVEHQTDGRGDRFTPMTARVAPTPVTGPTCDADSLAAVVASFKDEFIDQPIDPCTASPPEYAILCPDSFATVLASYASLWRARGVSTRVVPYSVADTCFGGYQAYIRWATERNTRYVLLAGDANDHVMWDDSTAWTNGWLYPGEYEWDT